MTRTVALKDMDLGTKIVVHNLPGTVVEVDGKRAVALINREADIVLASGTNGSVAFTEMDPVNETPAYDVTGLSSFSVISNYDAIKPYLKRADLI